MSASLGPTTTRDRGFDQNAAAACADSYHALYTRLVADPAHRSVPEERPLRDIAATDADYLDWILDGDFEPDVTGIVRDALHGEFPSR